MSDDREMPKYKCHKEVWALQIKAIEVVNNPGGDDDQTGIITPEEGYASFSVSKEYMIKHVPQIGGYYVVYKGGYKSFSPKEALENGYTIIRNDSKASIDEATVKLTNVKAIIMESIDSHTSWIKYYKEHPEKEAMYGDGAGDTKHQQDCIVRYQYAIKLLNEVVAEIETNGK